MGGLIVIDLIDMRHKRHRNASTRPEGGPYDKARTHVLPPISQLGLLEMTRQRVDERIESSMYMGARTATGAAASSRPST